MIDRRKFLQGLFIAPAVVQAKNIMPIWVPPKPELVISDGSIVLDAAAAHYVDTLHTINGPCDKIALRSVKETVQAIYIDGSWYEISRHHH